MKSTSNKILSETNSEEARRLMKRALDIGLDFKLQKDVRNKQIASLNPASFIEPLPQEGADLDDVLDEFVARYLPYCYNFASPQFMGFPDAGNSIAAISGNIIADFLQQNLINQSFCSPSGTFAEISVIRWLRDVVGYSNDSKVNDIFDSGGIITSSGTTSNTTAILLARENYRQNSMINGVQAQDGYYLVVPKGIGHYSVKSAQMWIGCGNKLIEVETNNFRYDLVDLKKKLAEYKDKIMGLVAYAGDSRTMTVDNMRGVAGVVKESGQNIWLHADACHGFSLGFSDKLKHKIDGISMYNSITTDPHKVMNVPYTISALLVKDPKSLKNVSSLSDLIMQEQYAFGQITPFVGSKSWMSLKIWFALKNIGKKGFGKIIEDRHDLAVTLARKLSETDDFVVINVVDINAVAFMYIGSHKIKTKEDVDTLNRLNKRIHGQILEEGRYHLHMFSLPDRGVIYKNEVIFPLRFMSGNPNTTDKHLNKMISYVRSVAQSIDS